MLEVEHVSKRFEPPSWLLRLLSRVPVVPVARTGPATAVAAAPVELANHADPLHNPRSLVPQGMLLPR
jgi:hypothetical protein